jgi:hypothetical protein
VRLARSSLLLLVLCLIAPASAAAASEPTLNLAATGAQIGGAVDATATLAEGSAPTGTIVFEAFGPGDPTCAGVAAFEDSVPVADNGEFSSAGFVPGTAGTYSWSAHYSGDGENEPADAECATTSAVTQASTGLGTAASSATVGLAISDLATISGGFSPTGQIVFKAFGPNDATCANTPAFENTVAVSGNGNYGSGNFTTSAAGSYNWTADYSGDVNNSAASSACGAALETSIVAKDSPGILTTATDATVGSAISDSATISAGFAPTGTVTFKAFGPNDATCAGGAAFEKAVTVSGNASYLSGDFTPAAAGTYRWTAVYSGDANNDAASSGCNAADETSIVAKDSPGILTTATNATVGAAIGDSATISSGFSPTGTVTFKAFGPNDATCANTPAFEKAVTVSGNATYLSGDFTTAAAGTYRWTAAYSGDANNDAANSGCNAVNETSTVAKASPGIVTTAVSAPVGFAISDSATISSGFSPTGTVTFKAFGPSDATCANAAAFEKTVAVNDNGVYKSGDFNGALAGAYRWTAAYSGDANNNAASSACNAANETSTVAKFEPTLATAAISATLGSPISDSATLAAGFAPTGTVTFKAFGPSDATCANAAAFEKTVAVNGNGVYKSGDFNGAQLGAYRWTVDYSGDANNQPAASGCNAADETSTVAKIPSALSANAASATIGSSVADIASFSGGSGHTGQIVFRAYGPDDAGCSGAPVYAATVDVTPGNGTYASGAFTPVKVGTYRWTASYSGDAVNAATSSACNAAGSVSAIAPATATISAKASAAGLEIGTKAHDAATLSGGFQPGGAITFRLFGPGDANCSAPPTFTDAVAVSANGTYASAGIAPAQPGQYRFTASYAGDAANAAAATPCSAAAQALTVSKRTPKLVGRASLRGTRKVAARATLSAAAAPKGKLTFQLFGPNNSRCAGKPAFSEKVTVHGGGSYQPAVFRVRRAGLYRLTVSYAGDVWNKPARSGCNASGQSVRIRPR